MRYKYGHLSLKKTDLNNFRKCSKTRTRNASGNCVLHLPNSERLKSLGLSTREYRREWVDMIYVYKILHNIDKADKEKIFQMAPYTSTRGYPLKLFKKRNSLHLRSNYFSHHVIDLWNVLSTNLVTAPSLNAFKIHLNKYFQVSRCVHATSLKT